MTGGFMVAVPEGAMLFERAFPCQMEWRARLAAASDGRQGVHPLHVRTPKKHEMRNPGPKVCRPMGPGSDARERVSRAHALTLERCVGFPAIQAIGLASRSYG